MELRRKLAAAEAVAAKVTKDANEQRARAAAVQEGLAKNLQEAEEAVKRVQVQHAATQPPQVPQVR